MWISFAILNFKTHISSNAMLDHMSRCCLCNYWLFLSVFKRQSLTNIDNTHQMEMLKSFSHYSCAAKSFSGEVGGGKEVIFVMQHRSKTQHQNHTFPYIGHTKHIPYQSAQIVLAVHLCGQIAFQCKHQCKTPNRCQPNTHPHADVACVAPRWDKHGPPRLPPPCVSRATRSSRR